MRNKKNNGKVPVIKPASSIKMITDKREEEAIKKAIKKLHRVRKEV